MTFSRLFFMVVALCCFSLAKAQELAPIPHSNPVMVYMDHLEAPVLIGEKSDSHAFKRTWLWDSTWREIKCKVNPPPGIGHAAAYDSKRKRVVMFGGSKSISYDGSTWLFDGENWTELKIEGPRPRRWHQMVYDEVNDHIILFGGELKGLATANDTWIFDGTSWKEIDAKGPKRKQHGMVYDPVQDHTIMYGGNVADYRKAEIRTLNDTWVFKDQQWKPLEIASPFQRHGFGLGFDNNKGWPVLFGGRSNIMLDDTWVLSKGKWALIDNKGPTRTGRPAMIYHKKLKKFLMFGAYSEKHQYQNEFWELNIRTWTQLK